VTFLWKLYDVDRAYAETPIGNIIAQRSKVIEGRYTARCEGKAIGRHYVSLASAQRAAETKAAKLIAKRKKQRTEEAENMSRVVNRRR
jgi:hypothetical protein